MPPSRHSFPVVSLYQGIKDRVATYRHGWFKVLVWFLFGAMTIALFPGMVAVWFWRLSYRPAPRRGRRLSMLLMVVLAGLGQLLWLNVLIIDPMAGIGAAQDQPPEVTAAGATAAPEPPSTVEGRPTTTDASRSDAEIAVDAAATTASGVTSVPATTTTTTTVAVRPATTETSRPPAVEQPAAVALEVAEEGDGTVAYDRDLYGSWTTVRSGCNTRCAVLEEERRSDGTWLSWYDGRVISDPSQLDIDHMVPLAEAHSSGAWRWSSSRKREYANDRLHPQALTAVSASSNRSKGARDPAEWRPSDATVWCRYATDWMVVKTAWGLAADRAEIGALEEMLAACDSPVTITTVPVPETTATTAVTTVVPATDVSCPYTSAAGDPCGAVPALGNRSNDVNCGDIPDRFKPLTVVGQDYDRLDGNNDGRACTS